MMQRLNKMFDGDWLLTVAEGITAAKAVLWVQLKQTKRVENRRISGRFLAQRKRKLYVPKMLALSENFKQQTLRRTSANNR